MKVHQSTGNVFRNPGFGAQEAESLRLRAELVVELRRLIQARRLTQRSAANLLGVTQPRISDLIRGKIDLFNIDTLVNCSREQECVSSFALLAAVVAAHKRPKSPVWLGQVGVLSLAALVLFHYPRRLPRGLIRLRSSSRKS